MRAFLTNRTATVGIANLRRKIFHLPNKGTPQGSVVSPLLFNVALLKLPRLLDTVPGIFHALYADDITLWTRGACTGEQEARLQEAVNIIERYLNTCGLHCAPDKSELLVLGERTRGWPPSHDAPDPQVLLQGVPMPKVGSLRVLGVHIHKDGPAPSHSPGYTTPWHSLLI
ncbi:uncharacterized protein [Dermacentor albipictus]|uniref:uncharacterized protein n=1 Tax=Dermacentor albipictus TaxID=60249 RepID=UPI0038FCC5F2